MPINGLLVPELLDEKLTEFLPKDHRFETEGCGEAYTNINWDCYRTPNKIVFLPRLPGNDLTYVEEFPVLLEKLKTYLWSGLEEDRN